MRSSQAAANLASVAASSTSHHVGSAGVQTPAHLRFSLLQQFVVTCADPTRSAAFTPTELPSSLNTAAATQLGTFTRTLVISSSTTSASSSGKLDGTNKCAGGNAYKAVGASATVGAAEALLGWGHSKHAAASWRRHNDLQPWSPWFRGNNSYCRTNSSSLCAYESRTASASSYVNCSGPAAAVAPSIVVPQAHSDCNASASAMLTADLPAQRNLMHDCEFINVDDMGGGGGGPRFQRFTAVPPGLCMLLSIRGGGLGKAMEGLTPLILPYFVRRSYGGVSGGTEGEVKDSPLSSSPPPSPPLPATATSSHRPRRVAVAPRDEELGAPMEVFDRALKVLHRNRSAALLDSSDPLLALVSERLLDRLEDCRRSFPTALVLGGAALPVLHQLVGGRAGIERVVVVDSSQDMLDRVKREEAQSRSLAGTKPWPRVLCVLGDEEHLPLRPRSVDVVISCLGLHWANDLPGAMAQCRMALAPDGLFLAAVFGGETLQELRISCALAQMEREGGVSAVVSPLAQIRDAGNILTRADLRLPAVDVDRFRIGYPSILELVNHLRALGESNAAGNRRKTLSRDSALATAAVYQSMFGSPEDGGCVNATFEVIFMTGWAPAANQPKAAKRGSATVSFQELADGLVKGGDAMGGTVDDGITSLKEGRQGELRTKAEEPSADVQLPPP